MKASSIGSLQSKLDDLDRIPTIPAILAPLLRYLELPVEQVDVQKVVDLISHDKSLTAQCLHMANSPLFGRWQRIETIRGAIVSLGVGRVRDIATSCCILKILPTQKLGIDPLIFWEHSLGCAFVSRRLARKIGFSSPETAYLAGLMHDLGIIVNLLLIPEEYQRVLADAASKRIPLGEAEEDILGFSHCQSGEILAEKWEFSPGIAETTRRHHMPVDGMMYPGLVSVVTLSDLLCRYNGLGYGYDEPDHFELARGPASEILRREYPGFRNFPWDSFCVDLSSYMKEVRRLVAVLFRLCGA